MGLRWCYARTEPPPPTRRSGPTRFGFNGTTVAYRCPARSQHRTSAFVPHRSSHVKILTVRTGCRSDSTAAASRATGTLSSPLSIVSIVYVIEHHGPSHMRRILSSISMRLQLHRPNRIANAFAAALTAPKDQPIAARHASQRSAAARAGGVVCSNPPSRPKTSSAPASAAPCAIRRPCSPCA
jgi:hypothetical protein